MLDLEHRSIGEGKERKIIIKKPGEDKESNAEKQLLERIQEYIDVAESDQSNTINKTENKGVF